MNGVFSPDAESLHHSRSISRTSRGSIDASHDDFGGHTSDPVRGMNRVNWIYFLLGSATLLPWNAVITATPFFLSRLSGSPLKSTFSSYFSAVYQLVSFVCLAHASWTTAQASKHYRISASYVALTLSLLLLFASTFTPSISLLSMQPATIFFFFSLIIGAFQASAGTYLLSAVIAYAAYFGPLTMQSVMSGQAAVAVSVSFVQLITTVSTTWGTKSDGSKPNPGSGDNPDEGIVTAASYFFFIATLGMVISYIGYRKLTKMRLFKRTVAKFEDRTIDGNTAEYSSLPTVNEDDIVVPPNHDLGHRHQSNFSSLVVEASVEGEDNESDVMPMSPSFNSLRDRERELGITVETRLEEEEERPLPHHDVENMGEIEPPMQPEKMGFWHVLRVNKTYNLAVMGIYIVTLSVFPPITSSIQSVNPETNPQIFIALHFLLFNVSDWIGRYVCSYSFFQIWSQKKLFLLSMSRIIFVALFLMCNVDLHPSLPLSPKQSLVGSTTLTVQRLSWLSRSPTDRPLINSDLIFFAFLFLFGFSNGWLTSLIMMAAPSLEQNKRMRKEWVDWAAVGASFSLAAGLVVGSISSFALRGIMCGCNPFVH